MKRLIAEPKELIRIVSNQDKTDELEQDARIALLQHYSSKASNQAIILVTLSLLFFGFAQTIEFFHNNVTIFLYEWSVLTVLFAVGFRAILKLLTYGHLTTAIGIISIKSEQETLKFQNEEQRKYFPESYWNSLTVTYLARLEYACKGYFEMNKHSLKPSLSYRLYRHAKEHYWTIVMCVLILFFVFSFFINEIHV